MPKNSDFPEYTGIKVEHTNFDALEYHQRKFKKEENPEPKKERQGLGDVKGMVSDRKRRVHNPPTQKTIDETNAAAQKDWRQRGLSNNHIEDH